MIIIKQILNESTQEDLTILKLQLINNKLEKISSIKRAQIVVDNRVKEIRRTSISSLFSSITSFLSSSLSSSQREFSSLKNFDFNIVVVVIIVIIVVIEIEVEVEVEEIDFF